MKIQIDVRPFPPATRADYYCGLVENELYIVDSDLGNRSVTNDLEAVLLDILRNILPSSLDLTELNIRYCDTEGVWDRIVVKRIEGFDGTFSAEILTGHGLPPPDLDLVMMHPRAASL